MAQTSYGVNAPEAVKLWRKTLFEEALKATWVGKFIGETSDSILQILPDTGKSAGDTVTTTLRMQLQSDGVIGDATLEGNEEALITYTDKLLISQQRNAVRSGGKMSDQRIPWSVREEAQTGLSDWFASRFDYGFFNQVAGNTAQTSIAYTGLNAPIAPDSGHKYAPNGHVLDQNLTTGDEFNLSFIDNAVALAKLATPVIRPVMVDGEAMYVAVLHTNHGAGQCVGHRHRRSDPAAQSAGQCRHHQPGQPGDQRGQRLAAEAAGGPGAAGRRGPGAAGSRGAGGGLSHGRDRRPFRHRHALCTDDYRHRPGYRRPCRCRPARSAG
jgi:hypothetical protein